MRDYARISPQFWTGETGKAIKVLGSECQVVALYLLTSPHSNMIGLYYLPIQYICHETGSTLEGASKSLLSLNTIGFCDYDHNSEFVWVFEMARFQIGTMLKEADKRVKGISNTYESMQKNKFLGPFFDRYMDDFHLKNRRGLVGASKPLRSNGEWRMATEKENGDGY